MFKDIGALMGLMKNLPKIQEEMTRHQQNLSQIQAEGDAGAGMVRVRVNGHLQMLAIHISDEALKGNDREMLEDLVKSATNAALGKVRQLMAEETQKMMGNMGLPSGMQLPGMG